MRFLAFILTLLLSLSALSFAQTTVSQDFSGDDVRGSGIKVLPSYTSSSATVSSTAHTVLITANPVRQSLIIDNGASSSDLYVHFAPNEPTTSAVRVIRAGVVEQNYGPAIYNGTIFGRRATGAASGAVRSTELYR